MFFVTDYTIDTHLKALTKHQMIQQIWQGMKKTQVFSHDHVWVYRLDYNSPRSFPFLCLTQALFRVFYWHANERIYCNLKRKRILNMNTNFKFPWMTPPWILGINWTYMRHSKDDLDIFWMSHVRSVYDLFQGVRMTFSKNKFTTLLQTHVQNQQQKKH